MPRLFAFLLALLTTAAYAETADVSVTIAAPTRVVTGGRFPVTFSVHNSGPDAAIGARLRIHRPNGTFIPIDKYPNCLVDADGILCHLQDFAAGATRDFALTFTANDTPGPMTIVAESLTTSTDPNAANDSASANVTVFSAVDLNLAIDIFPSLEPGKESQLHFDLRNLSSTRADSAVGFFTIPSTLTVTKVPEHCDALDATTYRCRFDAGVTFGLYSTTFTVVPKADAEWATISGTIQTPNEEANPADNSVTLVAPVYRVAQLAVSIATLDRLPPNRVGAVHFRIENTSSIAANDVVAELPTGAGSIVTGFSAPGWSCEARPADDPGLRCTAATLASHEVADIVIDVRFAAREMHAMFLARVTSALPEGFRGGGTIAFAEGVFYRVVNVTTSDDSGAGSLRAAIETVNAQCGDNVTNIPCKIAFQLPAPVPTAGWFTIAPRTALPIITAPDVAIDGELQTALTGDTNPRGPEIFLDGSSAGDSDGLYIRSTIAIVRGLAIGNFARNALLLDRGSATIPTPFAQHRIEHNYLGVDPTGEHAAPNGLRGLMAIRFTGSIANNVIGANGRSGIFLEPAFNADIRDNRIGVAATGDTPLPNVASGIYVGPLSNNVTIENNVIANAGDFGIAVARRSLVTILANRFVRTGQRAIDIGLDGASPNEQGVPAPVITSAMYDASTGDTIIEGTGVQRLTPFSETLYVYANDVDVTEGHRFLGAAATDREGHFTFRIHEDMRGAFITANGVVLTDFGDISSRNSTEMSAPLRVQ